MITPTKVLKTFIAVTAAFFMTAAAYAQSTILIVDQSRLLRDSEVGKHINRQVESIAKTMEAEVKSAVSPLESEGKSLQAEIQALGQAGLASRPDLKSRL